MRSSVKVTHTEPHRPNSKVKSVTCCFKHCQVRSSAFCQPRAVCPRSPAVSDPPVLPFAPGANNTGHAAWNVPRLNAGLVFRSI